MLFANGNWRVRLEKGREENILINPRKGRKESCIPENGLLLVNPSEAAKCLDGLKESGGDFRNLFNSRLVVTAESRYFAAGPAIGAPMAALTMEKLIALGAKRIILLGWCGAVSPNLRIGDVLVPDRAESGEGTSQYYPHQKPLRPGIDFSKQIVGALEERDIPVHRGCVWSTDAVYREDGRYLNVLSGQRGVIAVDMEFSALCAVARFRKIDFGAVLTVSDELWGASWRPGFSAEVFHRQKDKALAAMLESITFFKKP